MEKKPINYWGWGIVASFLLFAAMILSMVIGSLGVPVNLVTTQYYEKELSLADHKQYQANAEQLAEKPRLLYQQQGVMLHMPQTQAAAKGKVHFFRPSDSAMDFEVALATDAQGLQYVGRKMAAGRWIVQLEWEAAGTRYYLEQPLMVN